MSDETTRLRALLEQTEMPWRAVDVVDGGTVLGRGTAILRPHSRWLVRRVAEVDMGDGEECDTSHAALIVSAVNALPGLLDAAERAERAEARVRELEARLTAARKATEDLPRHLGASWWGQQLRAALVEPTAEVSRG